MRKQLLQGEWWEKSGLANFQLGGESILWPPEIVSKWEKITMPVTTSQTFFAGTNVLRITTLSPKGSTLSESSLGFRVTRRCFQKDPSPCRLTANMSGLCFFLAWRAEKGCVSLHRRGWQAGKYILQTQRTKLEIQRTLETTSNFFKASTTLRKYFQLGGV